MSASEVNFDGLVGSTHNYAGLSEGNLASQANAQSVARPRQAALQGIGKMRQLMGLGLKQAVLPPQERPAIWWLRGLGFSGTDRAIWAKAWSADQRLAQAAANASSMWAANAATVSPSADTVDGRVHLSVANLSSMLHRSLEAPGTYDALTTLFPDQERISIHPALPAHPALSDEGAANHMRLWPPQGGAGVEIFVYGRTAAEEPEAGFPARQTLEASRAIARRHGLNLARTAFLRQSRAAINAGAFHNDVVAVSHETCLFYHEDAFEDADAVEAELTTRAGALFTPSFVRVPRAAVSLADAVKSYLFNAQLLRLPKAHRLTLIAPVEARETGSVAAYLTSLTENPDSPIGDVIFVDVRESMRNGGGPACLRLRVALTPSERLSATQGFFLTEPLADALEGWVGQHYREELRPVDLADPLLVDEAHQALDALTKILPLGPSFYRFQRT